MISLIEKTNIKKKYFLILCSAILLFGVYQWTTALAGLYLCFKYKDKSAFSNFTFVLLAAAVLSFVFFGYFNGNVTIQMVLFFTITSFSFYYIGCYIVDKCKSQSEILYAFALIVISMALPHIVVTVIDIFEVGLVNPDRILSIFSENDRVQRSVTQRTVELSLCIGAIAFYFIKPKDKLQYKTKRLLVIVAIICELCSIHYVSRTGIAIFCIGLIIGLLFSWGISFRSCAMLLIVFVGYTYLHDTELYQVFADRNTNYSNVNNVGLRTVRWEWGLKEILHNPFGSTTYQKAAHAFAHNFWIDYGKISGVIPFALLILFSLRNLYQTLFIGYKKMGLMSYFAFVFTTIFIATLMTEPIHEGAPLYMFVYFLYTGMINRLASYSSIPKEISR